MNKASQIAQKRRNKHKTLKQRTTPNLRASIKLIYVHGPGQISTIDEIQSLKKNTSIQGIETTILTLLLIESTFPSQLLLQAFYSEIER